MEPQNWWFVDVFPSPKGPFWGSMLVFGGVSFGDQCTHQGQGKTKGLEIFPSKSLAFRCCHCHRCTRCHRSRWTEERSHGVIHCTCWSHINMSAWLESLRSRTRPRLGNFEGTKAPKHLPMWSRASHARTASAAAGNLGLSPVHEPPRPAACQVTWRCWISASLFGAQYDMSW